MSTDTSSSSTTTKSWISFAIMFVAGVAGGVVVLTWLASTNGAAKTSISNNSDVVSSNQIETSSSTAELQELRLLREEVEQLRAAAHMNVAHESANNFSASAQTIAQQPSASASSSVGQRTLAYWNELNSIMSREAAMRAAPPQITAGNAMSFVSGRTGAFEFASSAIQQLSTKGVDPKAVNLGRQIAAWYRQGIANSRSAESLLGSGDIAARQGAAGQGWSAAEKQHREQCLAINQRGEQLRQELTRKYGLSFPALQ